MVDQIHCGPTRGYAISCFVRDGLVSEGKFIYDTEALDDPVICLHPATQYPYLTVAHELGHLVDILLIIGCEMSQIFRKLGWLYYVP